MSHQSFSVFFGAGAEVGYGLPDGGKFALDIFRIPNEEDKEKFRKQIKNINKQTQIAEKWLPKNYSKKRLNVFGKGEFESLIASSLENKKGNINEYLDNFDDNISKLLEKWIINEDSIGSMFFEETSKYLGDNTYGQSIKLNKKLAEEVSLFESVYFSAFLSLLEKNPNDFQLIRIIRAFLELLIGAKGQNLVAQLNEDLFESAPDQLNVFDDFSSVFSLNYKDVGQTGLEIVIEEQPQEINSDTDNLTIFKEFGRKILDDIYCQSIDYQGLIDSHFRYLYNPSSHWAKFSRIAIFLHTVRRYILTQINIDDEKINNGPGYYHDLINISDIYDIKCIGTTNYNNFVKDVVENTNLNEVPIHHLNGSVNDYYDPYKNEILHNPDSEERNNRILVPFMFTQSGVKPLTTVSMSREYVELYDSFKATDIICVIGYAFNGDDGHINGLFRSLVEKENKNIIILHYKTDSSTNFNLKRDYKNKLRLDSDSNIHIIQVDDERLSGDVIWYDKLAEITSNFL